MVIMVVVMEVMIASVENLSVENLQKEEKEKREQYQVNNKKSDQYMFQASSFTLPLI